MGRAIRIRDIRRYLAVRAAVTSAGLRGPTIRRLCGILFAGWLALGASPAGAATWAPSPAAKRSQVTTPSIVVRPSSGPAGSKVSVRGQGFEPFGYERCIVLHFADSGGTVTELGILRAATNFRWNGPIPSGATPGIGTITAIESPLSYMPHCPGFAPRATTSFTVTQTAAGERMGRRRPTLESESAQMRVRPTSGPGGTRIWAAGRGFPTLFVCTRTIHFIDDAGRSWFLGNAPLGENWAVGERIPPDAAPGGGDLTVEDTLHGPPNCSKPAVVASASFVVTPDASARGEEP
jgi:hypothetical protein